MPIDSGNLALKGLDDLFSTEENRQEEQREQVQQIPIDALHPFTNHPFKVLDDEAMTRTVESIAQYGVLAPLIARPRPDGDGYEIISGHRRQYAAKLAGLDTLPVIVRQMSDDAAVILMVDSNLQREHILPSERAFAYKMKLDAIKNQGARSDLTSTQVAQKLSVEKVGDDAGVSKDTIRRFIRLTNLIPELLDMVDEKKIAFNPAVELSYLDESQQRAFLEAMNDTQNAPSLSQAQHLKKMAQQGEFSYEKAFDVMGQEKKSEKDTVTIKNETLRKYFPRSYTPKQMEEKIIQLLDGTGQHCSVFLRHVFWQGIQQRQDSSSRRTWLRCKGHVAGSGSHVFPCEHAPYGPGGSSHTYLDGSSGWLDHDSKGLTFEHYPDHQKVLLRWDRVEKYIDLMIQSDRYLSDKERRAIDFPLELNAASAAEYTALKAQHPDTLVGFEAGGNFMFYGEDAAKVAKVLNSALFTRETALGEVQVTGFPPILWARKSKELWSAGNDVYLAGLNKDGTHHQTKHLHKEDYLPIGSIINMDGRKFRIDGVDFDKGKVSLQDMALADLRMPIFREEPLSVVRELYEQQDEALDAAPEKAVDYKVGDDVVVDLLTRTIEGKIGYVGETDVRIDTSAQGQSWDNEVINKQQFEDGLRQVEPQLSDEKLDELPISTVMDGKVQTFPDAAALDESLNAEPVPEPAGNFHITDDDLGIGGPKQKYARNIEAIRTLFQLEQENRGATAEEQQVLSQYVGWGGLADAFDPGKNSWAKEYAELKGLLSEDEYSAARSSTLNAHYTSPTVIRSIYDAVERMGFHSGNILEPSMGVGNFFGMLPESMADSRLYGVELDSITGRIAQKLYPEANIKVAGFETTDRRDFYDLAVGNVPFGNYKVNDKAYNKLNFSIHNYFFAKAIDQVRPGGVVAFVTSRYTLDSKDSSARKHMAERADLLGAIRLPNNAFRANAGTDVVSDIIFLQKRDRPIDHEPDWVQLGKTEDGFAINQYFVDHPEMVLGELTTESTQYGREELTVAPIEGANLADQLAEAVQHIEGQYTAAEVDTPDIAEEEATRRTLPADPEVKNFAYTVVDGEVFYRENSVMTQVELSDTAKGRVTGMVELRQIVKDLIDQQLNDFPDEDIKETQAKLNAAYDAFTAKYGLINDKKNARLFDDDSSYYLLCSLENLDENKNLKSKADMFTKRTIRPERVVTSVDTPSEALAVSIGEHGKVDLPYMAELLGTPGEYGRITTELSGVIFKDPAADADDPEAGWLTADEYLSGNVRDKLRMAQLAAESHPEFKVNVDALTKAQPKDLEASEIDVRLGATWLAPSIVQQFMMETFQPPYRIRYNNAITVRYSPYTSEWRISNKSATGFGDIMATETYGTRRANAYKILEDGTRKFRDFFFSALAVQRLSDLICLEHQLSVIEIKPYRERQKRTLYPPKESNRDRLCSVIDNILAEKPKDYEEFLQKLEQQGYEVKRGKYTSVKGARQKRFIRFRTLGVGYSEEELKAVLAGEAEHRPRQKCPAPEQKFQMLVDIQAKLAEGKGTGFARWAKQHNLKEMSRTLVFLQENKIGSIEEMQERVDVATARYHELGDSIKASEKRLAEIAVLKAHIINYAKTRPVYDAYRKTGYSKRFLETHRTEITLHKAAKAAFNEANLKKLPKVKELDAEYSKLLTEKKAVYLDYRKAKEEMQELLRAKKNVELFFAEEKSGAEKMKSR